MVKLSIDVFLEVASIDVLHEVVFKVPLEVLPSAEIEKSSLSRGSLNLLQIFVNKLWTHFGKSNFPRKVLTWNECRNIFKILEEQISHAFNIQKTNRKDNF